MRRQRDRRRARRSFPWREGTSRGLLTGSARRRLSSQRVGRGFSIRLPRSGPFIRRRRRLFLSTKRFAAGVLAALVAFGALAVVLAGSVSAKPKAAKATFQAALVSDVGRFNDKSFNQQQLAGLNRAKKVVKIKALPIQSNNTSDYVPNLTTAVRKGSNIVIAAGFLLSSEEHTPDSRHNPS